MYERRGCSEWSDTTSEGTERGSERHEPRLSSLRSFVPTGPIHRLHPPYVAPGRRPDPPGVGPRGGWVDGVMRERGGCKVGMQRK